MVGVTTKDQDDATTKEYLDELAFLAETAGAKTERKFTQKLDFPNPKTFIGKGKMQEVVNYVKEHEIDMVIF